MEAIVSVSFIVESMHRRISPMSRFSQSSEKERASGLSGFVYNRIRNITEIVGKALDVPLGVISKALSKNEVSAKGNALRAALNDVLGDYLAQRDNALAITMGLKHEGKELDLEKIRQAITLSNGKLLIMVHGLCMNHTQWQQQGHDHGKALSNELGFTTVYLHYNTGLHISENGKYFSHILEEVLQIASAENLVLEMSIVAHSMGGLVSRSAYYQAQLLGHSWPDTLDKLIFLGTPHHGAPLEKVGGWIDLLLGAHDYTAPLKKLTKFRSAGIHDLRHGTILRPHSSHSGKEDGNFDQREAIPLPQNVNCYCIATMTSAPNKMNEQVIGDGLVSLNSALGRHKNDSHTLVFHSKNQWVGREINHLQLLSHADVYDKLEQWLSEAK